MFINRGWSIPVEKIVIREVLSGRSKGERIGGGTCFPVPVNGASKPRKELVKRFRERREEEERRRGHLDSPSCFRGTEGGRCKGRKNSTFHPVK